MRRITSVISMMLLTFVAASAHGQWSLISVANANFPG